MIHKNLGELSADHFSEIREAACSGSWAEFVRLMGGVCTPRKDQPIKPLRECRGENDYGDFVYEIRGLVMAQCLEEIESGAFSCSVVTKDKSWRIVSPGEVGEKLGSSELRLHLERVEAGHIERMAREAKLREAAVISHNEWLKKKGAAGAPLDNYQ